MYFDKQIGEKGLQADLLQGKNKQYSYAPREWCYLLRALFPSLEGSCFTAGMSPQLVAALGWFTASWQVLCGPDCFLVCSPQGPIESFVCLQGPHSVVRSRTPLFIHPSRRDSQKLCLDSQLPALTEKEWSLILYFWKRANATPMLGSPLFIPFF